MFDELLRERYPSLPKDIQELIVSQKVTGVLSAIAQKLGLNETQEGLVLTEVFLVLLGVERRDDLVANITEQAELAPETAKAVNDQVAVDLFAPISGSLGVLAEEIIKREEATEEPVFVPDHAPETDTDHMLPGAMELPELMPKFGQNSTAANFIASIPAPAAEIAPRTVPISIKIDNPFNFNPQPIPEEDNFDAPSESPIEPPASVMATPMSQPTQQSGYPRVTRTLENDIKEATQTNLISQKLTGASTLPKSVQHVAAPAQMPPVRGDGADPYREAPVA